VIGVVRTAGHAAVFLLLAIAACGYHFAGERLGVPEDVRSLGVGRIDNRSREHGLEKTLAFTIEREIQIRRQFLLADDPAGADAVLSGTIRELHLRPVAFDANDLAVQYELVLVVDLSLRRQSDGRLLWQASSLRETDEYSASSQVVVTSSSQFQQETLDAANLPCRPDDPRPCNPQFSNVQLAETLRKRAITRLLRQAVRDAYNQMVEGF
jgi:outer membrane lipopolysaccharide assembly protein LptE/RlpB